MVRRRAAIHGIGESVEAGGVSRPPGPPEVARARPGDSSTPPGTRSGGGSEWRGSALDGRRGTAYERFLDCLNFLNLRAAESCRGAAIGSAARARETGERDERKIEVRYEGCELLGTAT